MSALEARDFFDRQRTVIRHGWAVALLIALTLGVFAARPATAEEPAKDPRAVALAERTLEAMGGAEAWAKTRFLRFNFFGFRLHHWDRFTGRHRLEGKNRDGETYMILHNVDTRQGQVFLNGELQEGEKAAEWLQRAYEIWINDTYWLLMPYKLLDPGVNLAYDGEETIEGVTYDKLLLTFDQVGVTPGDRYWAYINRDTGLMDRWAYFLQDWEKDRVPTHWWWRDWLRYGHILLSSSRFNPDPEKGGERFLSQIATFDHLDDTVFTSPEPAGLK